jgi:hypothetical protein
LKSRRAANDHRTSEDGARLAERIPRRPSVGGIEMSVIGKQLRSAWRPAVALVLAVGLALPGWSTNGTTAQGSLPETAAAAPESTVLFHQLDLDFEGAQWQQAEALLARVGLPDALDLWRDEILTEGGESGDFSEADLDALLGGEMAFFVTSDAIAKIVAMHMQDMHMQGHDVAEASDATPGAEIVDQAFGMAAVLVPGDPDAAWAYAQRQVTMLAEEEGVEVEQAEYGDTEIIAVEGLKLTEDGDAMGDEPYGEMLGHHDGFAAARDGDFIIAGPTQADITAVVDVLNGDAPSLADSAAAQDVVTQLPADAISLTYFDMQAIVGALGPELIESMESLVPNMPREAWGGAGALAISATDVGFQLDSFATYPEGADLDTLLVPNDPAIAAAAERVPDGTLFFQAGILPPNSFAGLPFSFSQAVNAATGESQWDDEGQMMPLPSPEQIEAEIAKATETLGFNPATDLFDLLGTEFIAFSSFPSFSMEGIGLDAVAAVSTTDPVALSETTRKIAAWIDRSAPDAEVSVRREGEDTLFVVSDPESAETPSIEFGVVNDQAVVALGEGINQLLTAPSTPMADNDQFQTVMAELPSEFSQVFYLDIGQAIAPIMMFTGEFAPSQITDADLACTEFSDQAEAQEAYDADPIARSDLDLDFDGQACEDAFATAAGTPVTVQGSPENIRALGMVTFQQDEGMGSSAILYIAEPGS